MSTLFIALSVLAVIPLTLIVSAKALGKGNTAALRVIIVTGASGGLGSKLLAGVRTAFPGAVVYGTSRRGWTPPPPTHDKAVEGHAAAAADGGAPGGR